MEGAPQVHCYVEQCLGIRYMVESREYLYYPDVMVFLKDGRGFVVEIKLLSDMVVLSVQRKFAALTGVCRKLGYGAILTDGCRDFGYILSRSSNLPLERELEDFFRNHRMLLYSELVKIKEQCRATMEEVLIAVVKLNLSVGKN